MAPTRQRIRLLEQIVRDGLWIEEGEPPLPVTVSAGLRSQALYEVLACLPPEAYLELKELAPSFQWFIPPPYDFGMIHLFPPSIRNAACPPVAQVLYLSPTLERLAPEVAVAVVAQVLAHVVLGHSFQAVVGHEIEKWQHQAFALACQWGFEKESRKHVAAMRRISQPKQANRGKRPKSNRVSSPQESTFYVFPTFRRTE